jgi:uncharacterized protein
MNCPMILCMGTRIKLAVGSWSEGLRTPSEQLARRIQRGVLLVAVLLLPIIALAQEFPSKPSTPVVDYTGSTLSSDQIQSLNAKIIAFEDSTSIQFAVVIMKSIGGYDASEYAAKLGNYWGVGQAKKNDGIVMLISRDDRKIAIQIGKGLEGAATDGLTGSIIRREMQTPFRQGNFYSGIDNALTALMKITSGEFKAESYMKGRKGNPPYFLIILIFFIIIIVFSTRAVAVKRYARMNHLGFWAAWMLMNAASNRSRGSWGGFTGGGGFGGGGFGGGGGGWGGFGGGSFGGGGASGSW